MFFRTLQMCHENVSMFKNLKNSGLNQIKELSLIAWLLIALNRLLNAALDFQEIISPSVGS